MDLILRRLFDTGNETISQVSAFDKHYFFALEPEQAKRIPCGTYEIKKRITEHYLSDMTKEYRKIYDWFDWHLELQGVEGKKYIYIHHGNFRKDTRGCILVGNEAGSNHVNNSRKTYEKIYKAISNVLENNCTVTITIFDEP